MRAQPCADCLNRDRYVHVHIVFGIQFHTKARSCKLQLKSYVLSLREI